MRRHQFLTTLGVSAGTVIFAPFLVSCSKSSMDTTVLTPGGGGGAVDFTLDLSLPANAALNPVGGFLVTTNGVIIAHNTATTYVALASACTHQGYVVAYDNANTRFRCTNPAPGHGSLYRTDGTVISGPAPSALKVFNTVVTGTSLRVFA
jgi:cytochrome b6-f complex iron-sulfur subunit